MAIYHTFTITVEDEAHEQFLNYFEAFVEHNSDVIGVRDHKARTAPPVLVIEGNDESLVLADLAYEDDREEL